MNKTRISSIIILAFLLANLFFWHNLIVGLIAGFAYLLFFGFLAAHAITPAWPSGKKLFYGPLFLLSFISLLGAIIYFFYQLNLLVISLLIILLPILSLIITRKPEIKINNLISHAWTYNLKSLILNLKSLLIFLFLGLTVINFYTILTHPITIAVRSPWEIIPHHIFFTYFLATFLLLAIIFTNEKSWVQTPAYRPACLALLGKTGRQGGQNFGDRVQTQNFASVQILIAIHTFFTIGIALTAYPLGFGFDSFIHQATEKIIAAQGFILPKPFYYLGQYSLVVFLSTLWQINTDWVDKLLVPVLTALYLPATIYFVFAGYPRTDAPCCGDAACRVSTILFLLALPFAGFLATTPQSLANFFVLLIIFLSFPRIFGGAKFPAWLLFSLALTALLIHPLSGIPVFIFLILFSLINSQHKFFTQKRVALLIITCILSAIALPAFFLLGSLLSDQITLNIGWQGLGLCTDAACCGDAACCTDAACRVSTFNQILETIYLFGFHRILFLLLIAIIGIIYLWRQKQKKVLTAPLLTFGVLLVNYLILKLFFDFSFLIEYEKGYYLSRLLEISLYFLLPFFLFGCYFIIQKIWLQNYLFKFFFLLIISLLLTASLYLSYPVKDDYNSSRAFNVSSADFAAAKYIHDNAQSDYFVLANQLTSAAALKQYGFQPEYNTKYGPQFYYPLPTSSPLYQYYLKMVYETPKRETILDAMRLMGSSEAYFVINDYWRDSERIIEQTKKLADDWREIEGGRAVVFRFKNNITPL